MANNYVQEGEKLAVVVTHPATPTSGCVCRFGTLTGVALADEGAGGVGATETLVDFDYGVWDLNTLAENDSGASAIAVGDTLFYVDADAHLSKKQSGYPFGYALEANASGHAVINVLHVPPPGIGTTPAAGSVVAASMAADSVVTAAILADNVTAAKLTSSLRTGFINLDITTARIIATNAIQNTTEGGVPDGNTAPALARTNGATDKSLCLTWAASGVEEIQFAPVCTPPDLDDTAVVTIKLLAAMGGATDHPGFVISFWEGLGDTNAGGTTTHVVGTSITEVTLDIAAADIGAHPKVWNISLTPGTHGTDTMILYGASLEYTRK